MADEEGILCITLTANGATTKTFWRNNPQKILFIRECLIAAFLDRISGIDANEMNDLLDEAVNDGQWHTITYIINPDSWCSERLVDRVYFPNVLYEVTIEWIIVRCLP